MKADWDASAKPCSDMKVMESLLVSKHLATGRFDMYDSSAVHCFHRSARDSGSGSSHDVWHFHASWRIILAVIVAGVKRPMMSYIFAAREATSRLVIGNLQLLVLQHGAYRVEHPNAFPKLWKMQEGPVIAGQQFRSRGMVSWNDVEFVLHFRSVMPTDWRSEQSSTRRASALSTRSFRELLDSVESNSKFLSSVLWQLNFLEWYRTKKNQKILFSPGMEKGRPQAKTKQLPCWALGKKCRLLGKKWPQNSYTPRPQKGRSKDKKAKRKGILVDHRQRQNSYPPPALGKKRPQNSYLLPLGKKCQQC